MMYRVGSACPARHQCRYRAGRLQRFAVGTGADANHREPSRFARRRALTWREDRSGVRLLLAGVWRDGAGCRCCTLGKRRACANA